MESNDQNQYSSHMESIKEEIQKINQQIMEEDNKNEEYVLNELTE